MIIWGLTIIALAVAMIVVSVFNFEAHYHVCFAGGVLLIALAMMFKFVYKKPSDRQKILEKQLDEIRTENEELRAKLR
ncbi:MAG TPA: hypothetical protein ENN07_07230 [candidate division Zixibacteria bacterium]|nr:hypothetical protein [candidate division Zixibacteria bacterium]